MATVQSTSEKNTTSARALPASSDSLCGRLIVRDFGPPHGRFVGWVDRVFDESQTATGEKIWSIVYEDGDKEDLNLEELNKYLQKDMDLGEYYTLQFQSGPLGMTLAPAPTNVDEELDTLSKAHVPKAIVTHSKPSSVGRGFSSPYDSIVLLGWDPATRKMDFDGLVREIRTRPRPLSVVLRRTEDTIMRRKARVEALGALFEDVSQEWRKASEKARTRALRQLREDSAQRVAKMTEKHQAEQKQHVTELLNEFSPEFMDAFIKGESRALHWFAAWPYYLRNDTDRMNLMRFHLNHDASVPTVPPPVAAPPLSVAAPPLSVAHLTRRNNKKRMASGPSELSGPSLKRPSVKKAEFPPIPDRFPMDNASVAHPGVAKILKARLELIQTPSQTLRHHAKTVQEPVLTNVLPVGNMPVQVPQRGLRVWAFLDAHKARQLKLGETSGHYRATILQVRNSGQEIQIQWGQHLQNGGTEHVNFYQTKQLMLWGPAPSSVALFVYLSTAGKHIVCMDPVSQRACEHNFAKLRDAIQTRYLMAVNLARNDFDGLPIPPVLPTEFTYSLTFSEKTLGIGIDLSYSDGGVIITSVRPDFAVPLRAIQVGDYLVAAGSYRSNSGGLEELIHQINIAGRPLQLAFLRKHLHPKYGIINWRRETAPPRVTGIKAGVHPSVEGDPAARRLINKSGQLADETHHSQVRSQPPTAPAPAPAPAPAQSFVASTKFIEEFKQAVLSVKRLSKRGDELEKKLANAYQIIAALRQEAATFSSSASYLQSQKKEESLVGNKAIASTEKATEPVRTSEPASVS